MSDRDFALLSFATVIFLLAAVVLRAQPAPKKAVWQLCDVRYMDTGRKHVFVEIAPPADGTKVCTLVLR